MLLCVYVRTSGGFERTAAAAVCPPADWTQLEQGEVGRRTVEQIHFILHLILIWLFAHLTCNTSMQSYCS